MAKTLTLKLLGSVQILLDGVPLHELSTRKSRALLIYLAVSRQPHSRDMLAGFLWPEMDEAQAKANLRQALTRIRRLLPDCLRVSRHEVALVFTPNILVDALEFEELLHAATKPSLLRETLIDLLQKAVELYQGDFLAGFFVADAHPFEEWCSAQRERLRAATLQALDTLVQHHMLHQQIPLGLYFAEKLLMVDPHREENHQQMMRLLAWDGQITAALRRYHRWRDLLKSDLGVEPLEETTALYEQILALRAGARDNLPTLSTPLVGRISALADLSAWLHNPACRLITITGQGGIGKTQLALEVARRHLSRFLDGVYLVDLADVAHADQLPSAVASALGLSIDSRGSVTQQLTRYLRGREMLLLLDNFEQLLSTPQATAGLDHVRSLLAGAPKLKFIVTSRHRLNLLEEWTYLLEGLNYPQDAADPGAESSESVRLFIMAAQRVDSRFAFEREKESVVEICRLVEGLPLAINLAAGLCSAQSCRQIAENLAENLALLATSAYNATQRQLSMHTTFGHSWRLLTETEQRCLAGLSVFHNGFTLEAAADVADATLNMLSRLIDKSWLQQQQGRYRLHELVRLFAGEHLAQDAALKQSAYQRHSTYYMTWIAGQSDELDGPEIVEVVNKIQMDQANLRHAWQWAVQLQRFPLLAQGVDALTNYYVTTNQYVEGEQLLDQALQVLQVQLDAEPQADEIHLLRAKVLTLKAHHLVVHRRYASAIETAQQAIALAQQIGNQPLIARGKLCWGAALYLQGAYSEAQLHVEEGIELAQRAQLDALVATGWQYLGSIAYLLADFPQAHAAYKRAFAYYNHAAPRFPRQRAGLLNNIGNVYLCLGRFNEAQEHYQQTLKLRSGGAYMPIGGTVTLNNMGLVLLAQHLYSDAYTHFEEAMTRYRHAAQREGESMVLGNLSDLYRQVGNYVRAQECAEQERDILQEIGRRSRRAMSLLRLGSLCLEKADARRALAYARQCIDEASEQGELDIVGQGQTLVGQAYAALGEPAPATAAYSEAISVHRAIRQIHLTLEPLAGRASVALRRQLLAPACSDIAEILSYWQAEPWAKHNTAVPIYLAVVEVLQANRDPRAQSVLREVHDHLQARASRITDTQMRDSFLHCVEPHRRLRTLYDAAD